MTAAYLPLTSDNDPGLVIEQGAAYGPILFRFREQTWDEYTVTINAAGADGDTFTVKVYQSESDRPELAAEVVYTKQTGDDVDDVSLGLQTLLANLEVDVVDSDTGELVATPLTDFVRVTNRPGGGAFNLKAITKSQFLDIEVDATVPANITLAHDVDVQVDLTGASATAEIRHHQSSDAVLVTWTTSDYLSIISPETRGIMQLDVVPASETVGYEFEAGWWQLELTRTVPTTRTDRWFEGPVECHLSLFEQ